MTDSRSTDGFVIQEVEKDPNLTFGVEGRFRVIAVGYFAEDDTDVHCTHTLDDLRGAKECAEALRRSEVER